MKHQTKRTSKRRHQPRTLGMFFMGAGLFVLGLLALFLLIRDSLSAATAAPSREGNAPVAVSFTAPELNLTDLDGTPVALSDYRGQVVLLNNWATWCPPCKAEMPVLQKYFEDKHSQGFALIAVEAGDGVEQVRQFAASYGLTFEVWPDLEQVSLRAFRNMALPNSYVIDRQGVVRLVWNGAVSYDMLDRYVTPLLEE
jgi:cytochrome c biogenesis protein CcmG, thiol:disulfide interchange protein DsbE